jgi:hypothetical protein
MVNLLDIKRLLHCQRQLKDLGSDPVYAEQIVRELDKDAELRMALAATYAQALMTLKTSI